MITIGDNSRTEQENLVQEATILNSLGQCHSLTTNPKKAIEHFKRAINIRRSQNNPIAVANILGNLALAHKK